MSKNREYISWKLKFKKFDFKPWQESKWHWFSTVINMPDIVIHTILSIFSYVWTKCPYFLVSAMAPTVVVFICKNAVILVALLEQPSFASSLLVHRNVRLFISVLNILKSWLCESVYYLRDFKVSPPNYIVPLLVVNGNESRFSTWGCFSKTLERWKMGILLNKESCAVLLLPQLCLFVYLCEIFSHTYDFIQT